MLLCPQVLHLPADETTFDIALSNDSLAFTDGLAASVLGQSGANYRWHDAPSFDVVHGWIMAMLQASWPPYAPAICHRHVPLSDLLLSRNSEMPVAVSHPTL